MTPQHILLEWLRANPTASPDRRTVCERLANGPDMSFAWPRLLSVGAKPVQVFSYVNSCLYFASQDARRLPEKQERESVVNVDKAARDLLDALEKAPLFNEGGTLVSNGKIIMTLAWTDGLADRLADSVIQQGPMHTTVSVPEILRTLRDRCDTFLSRPQTNAIRRRTAPLTRSFVRRLAATFKNQFGEEMPEVVSRVACTVLQLKDPITGRDVEKILEDSPFRN